MKLAIFGSRSLCCEGAVMAVLDFIEEVKPSVIITSGETLGVCEIARRVSRAKAIPLKLYWLDENRCAGKYHWRSVGVLEDCDFCLFVHDGTSKGTLNEIEVCKEKKKPFKVVLIA